MIIRAANKCDDMLNKCDERALNLDMLIVT